MIADACFLLRLEVVLEILEVFVFSHPPFGQLVRLSAWPNNICPRFFRLSGGCRGLKGIDNEDLEVQKIYFERSEEAFGKW